MIQHAEHHFSYEQIKFLNRGPAYVSPCQIHILSKSSLTQAQIVRDQMIPLRRQLTKLFTKYPVDLARRMNFESELQDSFNESFIRAIPPALEERALQEEQLIRSTKCQLQKDQLILRRTADNYNTYYLGGLVAFNEKTNDYIENSACYELIGSINTIHTKQQHLKQIIQSISTQLERFYQRKLFNKNYRSQFTIGPLGNLDLPYLYFLPELDHNDDMLVQPRMSSCYKSPIYALAQYLYQLLRPLYENLSRSTTFLNGNDFIQKLEHHCVHTHPLRGSTHFATFKIHDLHNKISHAALLRTLGTFLVNPLFTNRNDKLSNEAIEELTGLVLNNNYFIFNGNVYRFLKGCPLNFPLTELLIDIYMHDWQLSLVRHIRVSDTFYGRFHTQGFLIWNSSIDQLQILLDDLQQLLESNIRMTSYIAMKVHFLDAYVENSKTILYTRVYRDQIRQRFLIPYACGHPRLVHRRWFRFVFVRAVQYCSSFQDFDDERLYLELTFLANGYSLDFVEYLTRQFLIRYNPIKNQSMNLDRYTYFSFRRQVIRTLEQAKQNLKEDQILLEKHQLIELHYLFDWGSRCQFNEKFHELWSTFLNRDPIFKRYGLKIKLSSKHCYTSNALLAAPIRNS